MDVPFLSSILIFISIIILSNPQAYSQNIKEIKINDNIQLLHLQDSIFIHITWEESEKFGRFPSNGMIIIQNGEAILVDTPMNNEKTKTLVEYVEHNFNVKFRKLIIGHFHNDCMGGIDYIHDRGIKSICGSQTYAKCKEHELTLPKLHFNDSLNIDFNGLNISCRFFGGGHTVDNIVIYIPEKEILFGGCLIKSKFSKGLGNTADANIDRWDQTVTKVIKVYGNAKTVIPGHGNHGGSELLHHTVKLISEYKKNN